MTREQAKNMLPIIQAFAEGKTIQYRNAECEWEDIPIGVNLSFADAPSEYRIKPEPKYRPFKSRDECWNEMLKHQPFGWIRSTRSDSSYCIISTCGYGILLLNDKMYFNDAFMLYTFADGTPFGIKEE